jgi:hypothetical protein
VVEAVGLLELGDVGVDQPQFAVVHRGIGVRQAGAALAQRLDLAADQHEAGLEGVEDLVVEARPAVVRDHLAAQFAGSRLGAAAACRHVS